MWLVSKSAECEGTQENGKKAATPHHDADNIRLKPAKSGCGLHQTAASHHRLRMDQQFCEILYIGGPTAVIEYGGLRFLTDPTFDSPGLDYTTGPVTLHKSQAPATAVESLGQIDAVLLSHDHHFDNLDHAGRQFLPHAKRVLTTSEGAARLGGNAVGLQPGEIFEMASSGDEKVRVTATAAQHGPAHIERGLVIGFVLEKSSEQAPGIYFSGDTVWFEKLEELARKHRIGAALLNLGAARVEAVGPWPLTMTAQDAVIAARTFPNATIVPLHFEGWQHFSEDRETITDAFQEAGLEDRLIWPFSGQFISVPLHHAAAG